MQNSDYSYNKNHNSNYKKLMKKLLLSVMAMLCVVMAKADETAANAILVWVDGSSTCYQLESMPQVTYSEGAAVLTLQGK